MKGSVSTPSITWRALLAGLVISKAAVSKGDKNLSILISNSRQIVWNSQSCLGGHNLQLSIMVLLIYATLVAEPVLNTFLPAANHLTHLVQLRADVVITFQA